MIPQIDKQAEDKRTKQEKRTKTSVTDSRMTIQEKQTPRSTSRNHSGKQQQTNQDKQTVQVQHITTAKTAMPDQNRWYKYQHYTSKQNQTATPKQTGNKENKPSKYVNRPRKTQPDTEKQPGKQAESQHIQKPMLAHRRANQRRDKTTSRNKNQCRRKENGRQNPAAFI